MQKEKYSIYELTTHRIIGGGVNPFNRRIIYLDPTAGSDGNDGYSVDGAVKTLAVARLAIATGKSDAIVLVNGASALSLAADPLIIENLTTFAGNASPNMLGKRSMIAQTTDYGSPMLTISGYGNAFSDLYLRHGDAAAAADTSLIGTLVSGNYNSFERVHWSTPLNATLGANSGYRGVSVTAAGNVHFDHCVIGTDSIDFTAGDLVRLGAGSITTWEDCLFLCRVGAGASATTHFFEVLNTSGMTRAFFKRCQFVNFSTNMATLMTDAFTFTGGSSAAMVFDSGCTFVKVTDVAAAANYSRIWVPAGAGTDKLLSAVLS